MRVKSEMICKTLEEHGGHARIARPYCLGWMIHAEIASYEPPEIFQASDLAVERIKELEERLEAKDAWQEEIMEALMKHRPHHITPEYRMGWELFCEEARASYQTVLEKVARDLGMRKYEDDEREYGER